LSIIPAINEAITDIVNTPSKQQPTNKVYIIPIQKVEHIQQYINLWINFLFFEYSSYFSSLNPKNRFNNILGSA
jgi:hypothetical protein